MTDVTFGAGGHRDMHAQQIGNSYIFNLKHVYLFPLLLTHKCQNSSTYLKENDIKNTLAENLQFYW